MPGITNYFQGIFGKSPFKPLQRHMDLCYACAAAVVPFLQAVQRDDWEAALKAQEQAVSAENQADLLKSDIRKHLPQGFFLPVARPDLLELLTRQDDIANKAKDIVGLMLGRRLRFPSSLATQVEAFAVASVEACERAQRIVHELDELLDTGFGGKEALTVHEMIQALDEVENRNDAMQVKLRADLYQLERDLPPVDVIFMYKIVEWIGDLADLAQTVGHRVELLIAR
jgi:predicted phosphate transport protein (TIGR00153 family)